MKLSFRLLYYFLGFSVGSMIVYYIWVEKNTSFDYGPSARVLKNIRIKEKTFSPQVLEALHKNSLDTSAVSTILQSGSVDFSKSNTRLDSCKQYVLTGTVDKFHLELTVENCDSLAKVDYLSYLKY